MADDTLAQEEIWDDSPLLESWNAAFEEYKVISLSFKLAIHIADLAIEIPQPRTQRRESENRARRGEGKVSGQWRRSVRC